MKKITLSLLLLFFVFNSHLAAEDADMIIAVVNDTAITKSEVQEYLAFASLRDQNPFKGKQEKDPTAAVQEALKSLIEDKLILQQAVAESIEADEAVIEARLNDLKSKFASEKLFEKELKSQQATVSDIKESIKNQELMRLVIERKIKPKVYVSAREVTDYYNSNKDEFKVGESREISLVYFNDKDEAEAGLKQFKTDGDFAKVFEKNPGFAQRMVLRKGSLEPDFEDEVFSIPAGEVSNVIESEGRFFIVNVLRYLEPRQYSLKEAQQAIEKKLSNEKLANELTSWLDQLKEEAYIVIK